MTLVKPSPHLSVIRHCASSAKLVDSSNFDLDRLALVLKPLDGKSGFLPAFWPRSCSNIGPKARLEDEHVCIDNLMIYLEPAERIPTPEAFHGVFDGHGGMDAASFVQNNILKFMLDNAHFPYCVDKAIKSTFARADHALADSNSLDHSSGTTALNAILFGRYNYTNNVTTSNKNREKDAASLESKSPELPDMKQMMLEKPPRHLSIIRRCTSSAGLVDSSYLDSYDSASVLTSSLDGSSGFLPVFRSGSCSNIGPKAYMEDEHVCIDNLMDYVEPTGRIPASGAFYGIFDGHGGTDAASFVRKNILKFILEDAHFPSCLDKAITNAFARADHALADSHSLDRSSGTTALTAIMFGRNLLIANAGDCRAVLGKRGHAVELSRDHKPNCSIEKLRIEKLGGMVYDGYLNGELSVARALGDWHLKGPKGSIYPLSSEPEIQETTLTEEDEFLIMGCDGLWDVMSSQCAVAIVRKELMAHNDPGKCSKELIREALKRNTCDNLTVVVVCFSKDPPSRIEIPGSRVRRSISVEGLHLLKGALGSHA